MIFSSLLKQEIIIAVKALYDSDVNAELLNIQPTNKEFKGDATLVVFPLLKISRQKPEETAETIGAWIKNNSTLIDDYNVIKGFLNLHIKSENYMAAFMQPAKERAVKSGQPVLVEYSSPNTNKPLHLGHIRNNLVGFALAEILKAANHPVKKVNIVNDRGIHICKSMLAWQKFGNGETPLSSGMKGDHLVGKYYVLFDKTFKAQIDDLIAQGISKVEAEKATPIMKEVQQMLRNWEAGQPETMELWRTMNNWVYDGFAITYKNLGVDFDKIYYESETYLLGKEIVQNGLEKGVFYQKPDGSVWVDLTDDGLDHKLLLRGDGTSVYITQDIGTAKMRYDEFKFSKLIYVVGNEQEYHFRVLKLVLKKLGFGWWNTLYHMAYNMVDLPSGKMKSREGTVVDADDIMQETVNDAEVMTRELGKLADFESTAAKELYQTIGMGALKYFILKVDTEKRMLFNPAESIDINGNTGPFIQYAYARIQSVIRKAATIERFARQLESGFELSTAYPINEKEKGLVKLVLSYEEIVQEAALRLAPSLIAGYAYDLAKAYNQFYHDNVVVDATASESSLFRISLSQKTATCIKNAFHLLGIEVPDRM